jgi:XTP/dITP diphosphohydrolase
MMLSPLVVASHNAGKVREINLLLASFNITVHSAAELDLPEPEETGDTFEANAELKARAAALGARMAALADDSGMAVPALGGAPGIYSARWAGEHKDFNHAMARVEQELRDAGVEPNGAAASFICVLSLSDAFGNLHSFRGEIHGTCCFPPRGKNGFGYDSMFIPDGYDVTFGEMEPNKKHAMSHRALAFAALLRHLKKETAA